LNELAEEMAVVLIHNCSSHITEAWVRVITVAPDTIQIFQVPDLTLFSVLQRHTRSELAFGYDKATAKFIMKVSHDFKETIVKLNNGKLSRHSDLSMTQKVGHIDFCSMSKSWRKGQTFESSGRLTFPWIRCQLDRGLLGLVGLVSQSKMTSLNHIDFSLIRYQDIAPCQKREKWKYREIHRISSKGLQKFGLFMRDSNEFLFWCHSIDVPVLTSGQIFSSVSYFRVSAISDITTISSTTGQNIIGMEYSGNRDGGHGLISMEYRAE
jgi:hypothetical protein